jgi:hypothetical protein
LCIISGSDFLLFCGQRWEFAFGRKSLKLPLTGLAPRVFNPLSSADWNLGIKPFFDVWRRNSTGMPVGLIRRAALKTTANALVVLIALATFRRERGGQICLNGMAQGVGRGTSAPSGDESKDRRANSEFIRVPTAMTENDFASADTLIDQAEALGVQCSSLFMGDTPRRPGWKNRRWARPRQAKPIVSLLARPRLPRQPTRLQATMRICQAT